MENLINENSPANSNDMTSQEIYVISYNSRGFNEMKQSFTRFLTSDKVVGNKIPILCNQENFLLRGNFHKILKAIPGFHVFINLNKGRPKGGMFIAVPDSLKNNVADASPGHWRIQAITIDLGSTKTLLINTYFPCDSGQLTGGNVEEAF